MDYKLTDEAILAGAAQMQQFADKKIINDSVSVPGVLSMLVDYYAFTNPPITRALSLLTIIVCTYIKFDEIPPEADESAFEYDLLPALVPLLYNDTKESWMQYASLVRKVYSNYLNTEITMIRNMINEGWNDEN